MLPFIFNPFGCYKELSDSPSIVFIYQPLTFTALKANSTVKFTATGSPNISSLKYRTNVTDDWTAYSSGTSLKMVSIGSYVQFMNSDSTLGLDSSNYLKCATTGEVSISGDLQSLLNYSAVAPDYSFYQMFLGNSSIKDVTGMKLTATTLGVNCYRSLFNACSGVTDYPSMAEATLANYCYAYMFKATGVTRTCPLPATTLMPYCYYYMFNASTSLTTASMAATTLAAGSCTGMFSGCTSLSSIQVAFTTWNNSNTSGWVNNVAASGTFTKPSGLANSVSGTSRIPSGWSVVNK